MCFLLFVWQNYKTCFYISLPSLTTCVFMFFASFIKTRVLIYFNATCLLMSIMYLISTRVMIKIKNAIKYTCKHQLITTFPVVTHAIRIFKFNCMYYNVIEIVVLLLLLLGACPWLSNFVVQHFSHSAYLHPFPMLVQICALFCGVNFSNTLLQSAHLML